MSIISRFHALLFNLDRFGELITLKGSLYKNHRGHWMFYCFDPAKPFFDVCLSSDSARFWCRWCFKKRQLVDYIE